MNGRRWVGLCADLVPPPTNPTGNLAAQLRTFEACFDCVYASSVPCPHTPQSNINLPPTVCVRIKAIFSLYAICIQLVPLELQGYILTYGLCFIIY